MTSDGARLAEAVAQFIGTPFRLNGRSASHGLDCVGLVAAGLEASGRAARTPEGYRLRNSSIDSLLVCASESGFEPAHGQIEPGDLLLVCPGPGQHHLLVAESRDSFIHAHAGLRRVIRMPAPLPWPILKHWRLRAET